MQVPIGEINVREGRRETDAGHVGELADSIRELGLLNPLTIDKDHTLIAGLHRLEAAKALGWTEVECTVSSLEGLRAELAEIDENFVRNGLSAVEYGEMLLRRKEIYETLHPETKNGGDRRSEKTRSAKCTSDPARSFVQDTAEKLGVNPSTVRRQIQTAKNLAPETKEIIRESDTKLSKKAALELSRLEPGQQKEAAALLASGEIRSIGEYAAGACRQTDAEALPKAREDGQPGQPKRVADGPGTGENPRGRIPEAVESDGNRQGRGQASEISVDPNDRPMRMPKTPDAGNKAGQAAGMPLEAMERKNPGKETKVPKKPVDKPRHGITEKLEEKPGTGLPANTKKNTGLELPGNTGEKPWQGSSGKMEENQGQALSEMAMGEQPGMIAKKNRPDVPGADLAPPIPGGNPEGRHASFREVVADLKDTDKDCSGTPDSFLSEFAAFARKFHKEIGWYSDPYYDTVFPLMTPEQLDCLRGQTDSISSAAGDLYRKVKRRAMKK